MEREVYRSMRALQKEHWWFRGRRRIVSALIESLSLPRAARILEAGAGSGGNIAMLQQFGQVSAFDVDPEVAGFCSEDTGVACAIGALPEGNPFAGSGSFDLVVALDVLEHIEQDVDSLRSLAGCLAQGGRLLLTVPAYPWLYSDHDRVHHHHRRYTRRGLRRAVGEAELRVRRCGYFNGLLLPAVVAFRLGARLLRRTGANDTGVANGRGSNALLRDSGQMRGCDHGGIMRRDTR